MLLITVVAGVAIGLALGGLGGGGSLLTVPVLVYPLGQDVQTATTAALIIVGVAALAGMVGHARCGQVRWRIGLTFGVLGAGTAVLGSQLSRSVDPPLLLLLFAVVMVVAAGAMLRREVAIGDLPSRTRPDPTWPTTPQRSPLATAVRVGVVALLVGLLTGFFGVGGGFLIVPALVLALAVPLPAAIGTSLLVIVLTCASALAERLGAVDIPWGIVVPFAVAGIAGALVGRRLAARLPVRALSRGFTALLIGVAGYVGIRAALDL
ncbi:sulfite exporter TauE/SafE family protein [soil metagenome]